MDKTICFDFDGVIHRYNEGWKDGSIYDVPIEGAKTTMEKIVAKGYRLVIFTIRLNPYVNEDVNLEINKITKWLTSFGFEKGKHYHELTAIKPRAEMYFDDKAYRFTSWNEVEKLI